MSIDAPLTHVLVISDTPGDFRKIGAALNADQSAGLPCFVPVDRPLAPADGLARLAAGDVDVLLLDVTHAPEEALDTLVRARIQAPEVPVVVLTPGSPVPGALIAHALDAGAQDVLAREQLAANGVLTRVLRYAIERQRLQATLHQLSLSDDLTSLYNRRGFVALCEHHLKLAHRTRGLLLAAVEVCGWNEIAEQFGRDEGDRALVSAANVLRATFRASDVVARLGGGDFAALILDAADEAASAVAQRLRARIEHHNAEHADRGYALEMSMGLARFDPGLPPAAEDLLARARSAVPGCGARTR